MLKRAKYFITCNELKSNTVNEILPENVKRQLLLENEKIKIHNNNIYKQLELFTTN